MTTAYGETLPSECPPTDAHDQALVDVYRILDSLPPLADQFKSHMALGKPIYKKKDPCEWASCSLVRDPVKQVQWWPKYRGKSCYAAKLSIPEGSGRSDYTKDANHINFWRYAHFSMVSAIIETMEVQGASNG